MNIMEGDEILSISLDYDDDLKLYPILLYTPRASEFEHYHIPLDREAAERLYLWLKDFLGENGGIVTETDTGSK